MKKTTNKFLAVVLAVICAMNLAVVSFAIDLPVSGDCGENVYWAFDDDSGTLTISGEGEMEHYVQSYYEPWKEYLDSITTVKIEDGVTSIGECAFIDCTALTEITIPSSVTYIGHNAFYNTGYYNNSANWEDGVLYIGNYLIKAEKSLSGEYNVKNGTKVIAACAFNGISENSYSIIVPGTVTHICDEAFSKSEITSVKVGEGTKHIGNKVFAHTPLLETVELPDSIEFVGFDILYNSQFVSVDKNYDAVGVMYINKCLICYKNVLLPEVLKVREGTKVIASGSLGGLYSETEEVILPESVVTIGNSAFGGDTYGHFACGELTKIDLSHLYNLKYIGNDAFNGCSKLKAITIPDNVEYIGESAFRGCASLDEVKIPSKITKINKWTFFECTDLKSITFGTNIKVIDWAAFDSCAGLTDVYFEGTEEQWTDIAIEPLNDYLKKAEVHYLGEPEKCGKVNSVSIDNISLNYKDSTTITPSISADKDVKYTVSYSSSDASVAYVDENGNVTAGKTGSATITCTVTDQYGNTVSDTCNVEVKYIWWQWVIVIVLFGWIWY